MSQMLVVYDQCGCRVAALLRTDYGSEVALFREEFGEYSQFASYEIRVEEHDQIGALRCAEHESLVVPPCDPRKP